MTESNPYIASSTAIFSDHQSGSSQITAEVVRQLSGTRPWVRFISIMVFIGAGFMVLAGLGMLVFGVIGGAAMSKVGAGSSEGAMVAGIPVLMAVIYLVLAVIYIFPGVKLWKYASRIAELEASGSAESLAAALGEQRTFWKFVGIVAIIMISLYLLVIVGAVIASVAAASAVH